MRTRNSCGDDHDVCPSEGKLGTIILGEVPGDFLPLISIYPPLSCVVYVRLARKCGRDRLRHRGC